MTISEIGSTNTTRSIIVENAAKKHQTLKSAAPASIDDTYAQSEETSLFKNIVEKYDITNMSRNEANDMYKELYDNDLISFKDMAFATLDLTRIPGWQDGDSSISGWKISSNPDKKMNFLEGYKTQVDFNKKFGNPKFQEHFDKILGLAEKIKYFQS